MSVCLDEVCICIWNWNALQFYGAIFIVNVRAWIMNILIYSYVYYIIIWLSYL